MHATTALSFFFSCSLLSPSSPAGLSRPLPRPRPVFRPRRRMDKVFFFVPEQELGAESAFARRESAETMRGMSDAAKLLRGARSLWRCRFFFFCFPLFSFLLAASGSKARPPCARPLRGARLCR